MKTLFQHIERVKSRPHHVRKRIAFAASACGAALVALVWFVGSMSAGSFSIQGASFADGTGAAGAGAASAPDANQNIAGVGAASALPQSANAPAHIEIIDAASSTRPNARAEQTVIPF